MGIKSPLIQTNLTSGEISPKSMGRFDITKFPNGAKILENVLTHSVGGVFKRPGTRFVADTKYSGSKASRLIPFQYSTAQDYVIEAGDLYFRFFSNDASTVSSTSWDSYTKLLLHCDGSDGSTTIIDEIGNTITAVGNAQLDTAQYKFGSASLLLDGTGDYCTVPDSDDWHFGTGDFTIDFWVRFNDNTPYQIFFEQYKDANNYVSFYKSNDSKIKIYTLSASASVGQYETTAAPSWNNNQWYHIEFVRSGSSVYIFRDGTSLTLTETTAIGTLPNIAASPTIGGGNGGYVVNGWIDEFRVSKGIARHTANFTVATAAYSKLTTLVDVTTPYLEADLFELQYAQNADVMYIVHPDYAPRKLTRTSTTTFSIATVDFVRGPFLDDNVTSTTITPSAATGTGITITASAALFNTASPSLHIGSLWKIHSAVVKITAVTDSTHATADVQAEPDGSAGNIGGTSAYTDWAEGAFSGYRGYPSCVCFHEQRLFYGNTATEPQKFWGSYVQAYDSFDEDDASAEDAVTFEIASNQINAILWLHSNGNVLQIGSSGGIFKASGGGTTSGEMITPTNIYISYDVDAGAAGITPVSLASYLYYVQRNLFQIREIKYDYEIDRQIASDVNKFSDHILRDGSGAVEIARQQSPIERIWIVRSDGQLAVLTRDVKEEILSWTRLIAGTDSTTSGEFESVCVIPKNNADDQVWVIVKRIINGTTKRYIEYFTTEPIDDIWDAVLLDSSLTLDSAKTITGATKANPVVITAASHGFSDGDYVKIDDVVGMTQLNGNSYKVTLSATNSFALRTTADANVNGTSYSAYISGGEARKMVTTVSGLSHLEGETVQVMMDGLVPTSNSFVVSSGAITLPSRAAVVHVGLPYTAKIHLLKLSSGAAQGDIGQYKTRRIYRMFMRLYKSLGGFTVGQDVDNMTTETLDSATSLFTGDIEPEFKKWWDDDVEIVIEQAKPQPLFILGIKILSETEEK